MQNLPENYMDIGVGAQVCIADADAIAIANGMEATSFRSGMEISIR